MFRIDGLVVLMALGLVLLACARSERPRADITPEHRNAIERVLSARRLPSPPDSLEVNDSGYLVATYELRAPPDGSIRSHGEDLVIAIREAMRPFNLVHAYRVTLNGPSPGTGLIKRYGSARLLEGGSVEWEAAR